jgi:hypothetical protein
MVMKRNTNKMNLIEAIREAMRRLAGHAPRTQANEVKNAGEMLLI